MTLHLFDPNSKEYKNRTNLSQQYMYDLQSSYENA